MKIVFLWINNLVVLLFMKLFTKCRNCKNELSFTKSSKTRVEFAMKNDENIMLSCETCFVKNNYFVNDIYAKKSKLLDIIANITFFVGTPIIGYLGYKFLYLTHNGVVKILGLSLIPIFVYTMLKERDRVRVNIFNRRYL